MSKNTPSNPNAVAAQNPDQWKPGDAPVGVEYVKTAAKGVGLTAAGGFALAMHSFAAAGLAMLPMMASDLVLSTSLMSPIADGIAPTDPGLLLFGGLGLLAAASTNFFAREATIFTSVMTLGTDFWQRAAGSDLGKAALAISDKMRGWHTPLEYMAVGVVTAAASAFVSIPEASVIGGLGLGFKASLDRLRAERQLKNAIENNEGKRPDQTVYPFSGVEEPRYDKSDLKRKNKSP